MPASSAVPRTRARAASLASAITAMLAPPCVVGSVAPIAATPGTCGAVDWADTAIGSATNASAELARNQIDVRTTVSPSLFVGRFGLSISHDSIGRRQKCKINSLVLAKIGRDHV